MCLITFDLITGEDEFIPTATDSWSWRGRPQGLSQVCSGVTDGLIFFFFFSFFFVLFFFFLLALQMFTDRKLKFENNK